MTIADMYSASTRHSRQNLRQRIFDEHKPACVANAIVFALLGQALWGADWAMDADHAGGALIYRLVCVGVLLLSALVKHFSKSLYVDFTATFLAFVICEGLFIVLLSGLDGGLARGAGEFLYFFLGSIFIFGLYPFYLNVWACLVFAVVPPVAGVLIEPDFHFVLYGSTLFPAAIVTALVHWRTRPLLVDKQRLLQQIETSTLTDPVTGLLNFQGLQQSFQRLARLGKQKPLQQFLLSISIDGYDAILATHGPDFINSLRTKLGDIINLSFRDRDITASLEEDEFVCILQNLSRENAFDVADRVRETIANTIIPCNTADGGALNCTVSIGIVAADLKEELKALINRSRLGLQQAKSLGGNQCACI